MAEETIKTLARQSHEELIAETGNPTILQGPFSTRNYKLKSVRLQTTLEELDILRGSQAIVRQGFLQNDTDKAITIPTIFAKVNGIPVNNKGYWSSLDKIENSSGLEYLVTMHLSDGEWQLTEEEFLEIDSEISVENLLNSSAWAYGILSNSLQNKIAIAIVQCFDEWPFLMSKNEANKQKVLRMCLDMPKNLMEMSLEVDYPKEVPLLAFLHEEAFGEVDSDDIVGLNLFHYLGWDIVIYTPNGFASIENVMPEDRYDQFYFEKMASTQSAKGDKISFFQKLKGKLFN